MNEFNMPHPATSRLTEGLNAEQLRAVTLPDAHALILAGAGSGKTRVLTSRIAWLISHDRVSPAGVLAVTFTNKAAKEMLTRLSAMLPLPVRGMWVGTFHGLCNRLLRAHYREANLPQLFQILDSGDQLAAIKRLIKALGIDDQKHPPREIQHFINAHKEQGLRASQVEAWDDFTRRRQAIYQEYETQCQREGVVDFAELLLRCHELLERNEPLRQHYQSRFRHILVDEFQDTNRLQYAWLRLLAGGEAALFAVGDDDQSIYGFRGAEVANLSDFRRDYAGELVIRLEQNYRSAGSILDAANALIRHNRDRLGKELWTDAGAGEPLRVFEATTDHEEAQFIADEVRALARDGQARHQMAVLYRSNAQSRALEHALFAAGIPYRVYGGLRFFERQEIKHALAYLRLIANPDDDTAFLRVVNFPTRGIGARSLEALQAAARQMQCSLYNAAASLAGKPGAAVRGFVALVERLRAETALLPLPEVVEHVVEVSGLADHYRNEREGQERLANLDELQNAAAGFAAESESGELSGDTVLAGFLTHAALEAGEHQAGEGEDALQLMTVHAAKGLEFDVVFITGLEQGLFPHENSMLERDGVEEERRLMYVAITRARQRLYLSHAQNRMLHGQTRYSVASAFFDELPVGLLRFMNRAPRPYGQSTAVSPAAAATRGGSATARPACGTWRVGQSVAHDRFGAGVIVSLRGDGSDAQVQINFGGHGLKWLLLNVAKLTPA